MCTVIAWNGKMPKGFFTNILEEAETRGRDSTGFAFRNVDNKTQVYRQAISAAQFTKHHQKYIGEARKSKIGIAHTRRASAGMPVNNGNAHPFVYGKLVFAHNGKIDNWEALKKVWGDDPNVTPEDKTYFKSVQTDSQVLGPYLQIRNLRDVTGAMGLVWMRRGKVFCARSKKELVSATVTWSGKATPKATTTTTPATPTAALDAADFEAVETEASETFTVVCSTKEIITKALDRLDKGFTYTVVHAEIPEAEIFEVTTTGLVSEGKVEVAPTNHEDLYSDGIDLPLPGGACSPVTALPEAASQFVD